MRCRVNIVGGSIQVFDVSCPCIRKSAVKVVSSTNKGNQVAEIKRVLNKSTVPQWVCYGPDEAVWQNGIPNPAINNF